MQTAPQRRNALGIAGTLDYDPETGAITLSLDQALPGDPSVLALRVTHPTLPDQDQAIQLTPLDETRFVGRASSLSAPHTGNCNCARLTPLGESRAAWCYRVPYRSASTDLF